MIILIMIDFFCFSDSEREFFLSESELKSIM